MTPVKTTRRRKSVGWLLVLLFLTLTAFTFRKEVVRYSYKAYRWYSSRYRHHDRSISSSSFPDGYAIHGVDVSRYQYDIDWDNLRARTVDGDTIRFEFAFIKATEGALWSDWMFDYNWDDAKDNHVIRGAYHYFRPGVDANGQAKNFIRTVKLEKGDLPPVVDVEETGGKTKEEIVAGLKVMLTDLEVNYKVRPILYSNVAFVEEYLADDFKDYPFWIAHFYVDQPIVSDNVNWLFWQHSDKACLFGCDAPVDADVFNGDKEDLQNLLMK